jgi:hypothetical protein
VEKMHDGYVCARMESVQRGRCSIKVVVDRRNRREKAACIRQGLYADSYAIKYEIRGGGGIRAVATEHPQNNDFMKP